MDGARRHLAWAAAAVSLLLPFAVVIGPLSSAQGAAVFPKPDSYENAVRVAINDQRTTRGLVAVKAGACADTYAESWARHLAVTGDFLHQDLTAIQSGCQVGYVGEILARGTDLRPREAVRLWMHSTGHRHIITNPVYRRVGVGAWSDSSGNVTICVVFVRP